MRKSTAPRSPILACEGAVVGVPSAPVGVLTVCRCREVVQQPPLYSHSVSTRYMLQCTARSRVLRRAPICHRGGLHLEQDHGVGWKGGCLGTRRVCDDLPQAASCWGAGQPRDVRVAVRCELLSHRDDELPQSPEGRLQLGQLLPWPYIAPAKVAVETWAQMPALHDHSLCLDELADLSILPRILCRAYLCAAHPARLRKSPDESSGGALAHPVSPSNVMPHLQ